MFKEQEKESLVESYYLPIVLSAARAVPTEAEIATQLDDARRAKSRGYFLPDEDERLCDVFARYLAVRSSLLDCVYRISQGRLSFKGNKNLHAFVVAFMAACILVRAGRFIVELAEDNNVVKKKLDQPEPRFGLQGGHFSKIYSSLTSPRRWWAFYDAVKFFEQNQAILFDLQGDLRFKELLLLLKDETPWASAKRRDFIRQRLGYRLHALLRLNWIGYRQIMFHLMRLSGSVIAELKQPFVKPSGAGKRVTPAIRKQLESFLQPGDVLVTRHDDAMSNLFLPGFWPHAALYIGSQAQRDILGVVSTVAVGPEIRFLEAKKDGVKLRPPTDTLHIDAFTVLRPRIPREDLAKALSRGLSHAGKLYDFIFDFGSADRLACTELVYRSYHGIGAVAFWLEEHAGRHCLSAEDLIDQAVGKGWFEPVLVYGLENDAWVEGPEARKILRESYSAGF